MKDLSSLNLPVYVTQAGFAKMMGVGRSTLSYRLKEDRTAPPPIARLGEGSLLYEEQAVKKYIEEKRKMPVPHFKEKDHVQA